jgi:hypothetical protein
MPEARSVFSAIVLVLVCLAVALTLVASLGWFSIAVDHELRGGVMFRSEMGPLLSGVLLLLAVVSGLFYLWRRRRRDLWSLVLSSAALLLVLGETIALFYIPLRGPPWPQ